jgi:hypothetical protein
MAEKTVKEFIDTISNWPVIIQGALGSVLFWFVFQLLSLAWKSIGRALGRVGHAYHRESLIREWVYRKYTSRDGLINITQGYLITFDHVTRYVIQGIIFIAIALIISGIEPITFGIIITAALYFFFRALNWLTPSHEWSSDSLLAHWQRIAELEQMFFGKIDNNTLETLKNINNEPEDSESAN